MDDALSWLQASRQSDIASLQRLRQTGKLITTVSELVHQLQRERGASNLWICSEGRLYGEQRLASEQDVTRCQRDFCQALPRVEAQPGYSRFCNLIAAALQALAGLPALRQQITQQQIAHAQVVAAFSTIIRSLLNLVFEAADTASHPDITRALIALFSFMQGKELTGQEMQQVVDTWQCEWQTTLADPSRRALFTATVNSDQPDETLHYARVRGQRQPHKASGIPLMHLPAEPWSEICPLEAIPPEAGIGARLGSVRIALFRMGDDCYALEDREPGSEASVLSRGILGDVAGEPVVISPLYKQRVRLRDGQSLDNPQHQLRCWPVKLEDGQVWVANRPLNLMAQAS